MLFQKLLVWRDSQARSGPENMAVDEWLMEQVGEQPILRLYDWAGDWVSLGYFQSFQAAKDVFGSEPRYVRRWTGGGVVDHRNDATYTLVIPRSEDLAGVGGSQSYRAIHQALADCLKAGGHDCELVSRDGEADSVACFQKPVEWDLLCMGRKIAGAGQRRTRKGMLHQGSVALEMSEIEQLPSFLARELISWSPETIQDLSPKYDTSAWLERVR